MPIMSHILETWVGLIRFKRDKIIIQVVKPERAKVTETFNHIQVNAEDKIFWIDAVCYKKMNK